jgi:hypothetical protein
MNSDQRTQHRPRHLRVALLAGAVAAALLAPLGSDASAADPGLDGIGPGSPILVNRSDGSFGCTANFIWKSGTSRYLGAAGHCLISDTDGTRATRVRVCEAQCVFGATTSIANSALNALTELCGPTTVACSFPVLANGGVGNDFALIPLSEVATSSLRREVPIFGGPSGTATVQTGTTVCMYGTGVGPGDTAATKGRPAVGVGSDSAAWFADGVGTPGDSGAPVVTCESGLAGAAVGFQTHAACLPASEIPPSTMCGTTVARAKTIAANKNLTITILEPS